MTDDDFERTSFEETNREFQEWYEEREAMRDNEGRIRFTEESETLQNMPHHLITFGSDHAPGLYNAMMIVGCTEEQARGIATALYPPKPGSVFAQWSGIYSDQEADRYIDVWRPAIFRFVMVWTG